MPQSHSRLHCQPAPGVRAIAVAGVVIAAITCAADLGAQPEPPPPPPPRAGAAPPSGQLEVVNRVDLGALPVAAAALDDDSAYIALRDGRIVATDLATARVRWAVELPSSQPPAAGSGLVFVAGGDGLTALTRSGAVHWRIPITGGFSAPLLWDAGWLIAPLESGDVLCLRATDGEVLWRRQLGSPVRARPAIAGDRVYLSLEDGRVVAAELVSGNAVWEQLLGGTPGPVLAFEDRLFVGSADKFFYCLSTRDGDRRWRWRTGGPIVGPPVVDTERVYFAALDNVLRALDRFNGSQRWKAGLPLRPSGGPLLVGRVVIVGGVAAELRSYRATDGSDAGRFRAPAELAAPPQLWPHASEDLTGVVLLTRTGELQLLRRRIEPATVPLDYLPGVPVPLMAPPVPTAPAR